jgi:uncharacterized membrane protein YgcG
MKVMLSLVALVLVVAATPSEVVPIVAANGYYIEEGADATQEVVGDAVAEARFAGGALSVVVLAQEPPAGATTFADSVLSGLPSSGATVLVVAPETVGWASAGDVWSNGELDAALDASLDGRSSDDVVTIFISELLEPSTGGASGMVIFLGIVVLVGGAFAFFAIRASKRQRKSAAAQVEALRATAQLQIDAIANDILDLEDEVKLAQDPKVQEHYSAAVDTYTTASERLAAMSSGKEIVEFDYELDLAVWNLDTAEAILDGNPLPDKPERPVYTPLPAKPPARPASSEAGSRVAGTLPQYQRRSQRRSSYGASEMLATVLATQAMRGMGGRRRSGSFGSFGGSRSSGGRSRSTPRMRGGGRRR